MSNKWVPLASPLKVGDRVLAVQIGTVRDFVLPYSGGRVERIEGDQAVVSFDPPKGLDRASTEEHVRAIDGGPVIPGAGAIAVIRVR